MNEFNPLDSILFITLPKELNLSAHQMELDYSIPLPVQKRNLNDTTIDFSQLTAEMIFAGILTVLAYDTSNEHLDYYRKLILSARPDIKQELTEAAILKTRNEDFDIAEEKHHDTFGFSYSQRIFLRCNASACNDRGGGKGLRLCARRHFGSLEL